ncbi:hypothetical protein [Parablautia muri]|uniref:Uncharacterized protein n=1 Tax=Parablautia muri TaxID=2320879 RepID=A0A9X5BG04_9FIRM|nr:hypothetical protein [Parablautia muri]NBJ93140.1 hypothetical protein [Parablautia muri]
MAILYTIGNINLHTVELVAKAVREAEPQIMIHKVVIFDSPESEKLQNEQVEIYRKYFGNFIREGVRINPDGSIDTLLLFHVFANDEEKIVDLSNGQKATSSLLFMAANLCQIDRIYYLILKSAPKEVMLSGRDYDYIKMRQVDCVSKLAKISYFDLIYYNDEMRELFSESERRTNGPLKVIYDGLSSGIKEFFSGTDYRSVVANVTIGNEKIIHSLVAFLQDDKECRQYCADNKICITANRDPVGILTYFSRSYVKNGKKKETLALAAVPNLLASLREYRNISAHYSENGILLTEDQGRIVINLCIEVIKNIHENTKFWEFMKKRK